MLTLIAKHRITKLLSLILIISIVTESVTISAIASPPSIQNTIQAENLPSSQASDNEYVDLYNGDFKYNIPLMAIPGPNGGYPLNLSYNSNVGMETEASWVGLGWNLNIGAISREMRGIPDDYSGETISYESHFRPYKSRSVTFAPKSELFGYPVPPPTEIGFFSNITPTIYWNNYYGAGYNLGLSFGTGVPFVVSANLGLNFDSQNGIGYSGGVEIGNSSKVYGIAGIGAGLSLNGNTRSGLNQLSFSANFMHKSVNNGYNINQPIPKISIPSKLTSESGGLHIGRADSYLPFSSPFGYFRAKNFTMFSLIGNKTDNKPVPGAINKSGYGYMNMQVNEAINNSSSYNVIVKDFNRSAINYSQKIPNLPPSFITPDNFIISGQGIGGSFKACKNETSILSDPSLINTSNNKAKGLEAGVELSDFSLGPATPSWIPDFVHVGTNKTNGYSVDYSGSWHQTDGATLSEDLEVTSTDQKNENYYFKMIDEVTGENVSGSFYDGWKTDEAFRPVLKNEGPFHDRHYVIDNGQLTTGSTTFSVANPTKTQRQIRNTLIYTYSRNEAKVYGKEHDVTFIDYDGTGDDLNDMNNYNFATPTNKFTGVYNNQFGNQISEINVIKTDGTHYIYGLPVYTHQHHDELHSTIDQESANTKSVPLESSEFEDDYSGNETNQIKYITNLSPYPSSWLLTTLHSDDYHDLTDNGPTDDDYGYWVKFNYRRIHSDYLWRNPIKDAYFNGGKQSDNYDNTAFFSYGTKDVTYIENIETKTHLAKFYISFRDDGYESGGEFSTGLGLKKLCKLDSIKLYIKDEYLADPSVQAIQTVVFEYDYTLCDNYVGNGSGFSENGKLTLKKLYIYTENSKRGKISPYIFSYKTTAIDPKMYDSGTSLSTLNLLENPDYNLLNVDRWGFYSPFTTEYSNNIYPYAKSNYTEQTPVAANPALDFRNSAPWTIKEITTPTGALLKVRYESDDYTYVETEYAQQMYDITDPGKLNDHDRNYTSKITGSMDLSGSSATGYKIYFNPPDDVMNDADVFNKCVKNLTHVYYKAEVELMGIGSETDVISGYAKIKRSILDCDYIDPNHASITVEPEEIMLGLYKVHPIRKAAWEYLKLERPDLLWGLSEPSGGVISVIGSLLGSILTNLDEIETALSGGYFAKCLDEGYALEMKFNGNSQIRLCCSDEKKLGGGYRVKQILINDNWKEESSSSDDQTSSYGEEYFYDNIGDGTGTSSGVAYEPELGGDENALLKPIEYEDSHLFRTTYNLFLEKPMLKALYPSAGVGYGKVTVRSIAPAIANANADNIEANAAPYTVYEFFTPKNFPMITDETDLSVNVPNSDQIGTFGINASLKNNLTRSQGYSIVTNDMPGKLKKVSTYKRFPFNVPANFISSTSYIYHTNSPYNETGTNHLKNKLLAVKATKLSDGTIEKDSELAYFGIDEEIYFDFNENRYNYNEFTKEKNLDLWILAPTPPYVIPAPTWYNSDYKEESYFRHVTAMKLIRKTGVLKEVIVNNGGAVTRTENVAYDFYTGEPIITKTNDEFKNPIYSFTYKGYWSYPGMNGKYLNQNIGFYDNLNAISLNSGIMTISGVNPSQYFKVGDKVYIDGGTGSSVTDYAHVYKVTSSDLYLAYLDGTDPNPGAFASNGYIKIVEPNASNQWDIDCGSIVAGEMNINSSGIITFDKIIDANAISFKDEWQMFNYSNCGGQSTPDESDPINPFALGVKGVWRPSCSYSYLTDRTYIANQGNEGYFNTFTEFSWDGLLTGSRWVLQGTNSKYSPYGYSIETKKTLARFEENNIYSSADYNNKNKTINSVCSNASYHDFYFNSFEELNLSYNEYDCKNDKMDYSIIYLDATDYDVINSEAHTGKKCLSIDPGKEFVFQANLPDELDVANLEKSCDDCFDNLIEFPTGTTASACKPRYAGCSSIRKFNLRPDNAQKYVISCWVKSVPNSNYEYTEPQIEVAFEDAATSGTFTSVATASPSGQIIDGWQRINFVITSSSTITDRIVQIKLKATGANACLFDDFRIHPFNSHMQSYVYDLNTLKLRAILDEENYATFYGYDQAGVMQKTRKETIDGIKTISETRGNVHIH